MFQFAIDRGGTFTDIYAKCPGGKVRVMKLLSVDPANYGDAPREGIRRILEEELGKPLPADQPVPTSSIEWIRMGTTVATNALLERQGARMALLINAGFRDLLHIGNQARPKIFDLEIVTPDVLYEEVVEVDCRVVPAMPERCQLPKDKERFKWREVEGSTGEKLLVSQELDLEKLRVDLSALKQRGINSLAVVFAHAYTYGAHEDAVGELAKSLGFAQVSLSHRVSPAARLVPRGFTCCADAYLSPHIQAYLNGFAAGFQDNLAGVNVLFMQSDGGLTPMRSFSGCRAVLSGPAGGVVGYARTAHADSRDPPVIGFDMGGTSTDVSRYDGSFEHVFESTTAGVTIQAPQLDVNTVAAGGGSRLWFRAGLFAAGPESAGAHPGPACYRKGGPLTLTDANLRLGRLLPAHFPRIFGPTEDQPLDTDATFRAFDVITTEINEFQRSQSPPQAAMSAEEVAMGFVRVANEAMCRPIRALTQAKGYDTSRHTLACFGGAGGQHACAVARELGMRSVRVHRYAGILSAFGMALADVVHEAREPSVLKFEPESFAQLDSRLDALSAECREQLREQGFSDELISTQPFLNLRYDGTDCALMCAPAPAPVPAPSNQAVCRHGDFATSFLQRYQNEFGFTIAGRAVLVDDVRVRGVGASSVSTDHQVPAAGTNCNCPPVTSKTKVYFAGGYRETAVYELSALLAGHKLAGPAIVMDGLSTLLIEPDCTAVVTGGGDLLITIGSGVGKAVGTELEPVQLSIFSHRFMSIAEQMGRILQRTSISTNIKERLDFSCALFGPDGGLVSNAPHIPVHLGAMQETVQYQMRVLGDDLQRGDVILSNHPVAGGSHLPDLTVITPVFYESERRPVFFVASRGHHADIGGITPGSMPPHSTSLAQEGAAFKSFKLVSRGTLDEAGLVARLTADGEADGAVGTRNLADNLSDLRAQIAANQKGIGLVSELIDSYGLPVVQAYMGHIQRNAELAVRDLLRRVGADAVARCGASRLHAIDRLDDGSPIELLVDIDTERGEAVFDFTGTGPEVWGNCNAPRAITLSALIYCLRCMVGHDVPLNQGCLVPVKTVIPAGCLLSPSETAAVVGGNVLTSQRVVDVVFAAFRACAASQGCMNNVTFGEPGWGYYETVAGGAGAGATWAGRGGVHTHMTNTRITDPELLERRYPVILRHFSLRPGSGGAGKHRGGDGVRRELLFRRPMTLSVLTERRVCAPYGMAGGEPGERGLNLVQRCDGRVISLGPKTAIAVEAGDVFQLLTPGGGGYGRPEESGDVPTNGTRPAHSFTERGSVFEWRQAQEQV